MRWRKPCRRRARASAASRCWKPCVRWRPSFTTRPRSAGAATCTTRWCRPSRTACWSASPPRCAAAARRRARSSFWRKSSPPARSRSSFPSRRIATCRAWTRPRSGAELMVAWNVPARTGRARGTAVACRVSNKGTKTMGLFSKDIKTMNDLFVHTLRDIYYAENQIVKSLPEMIEKASDPQLKQGLQGHLRETENHVKRLEQVFRLHGTDVKGVDCPAIDGIIEEAEDVAGEVD